MSAPLTIVGKTASLPKIVGVSPDGTNLGVNPLYGAGITHLAIAAHVLEEAAKKEFAVRSTAPAGKAFIDVAYTVDPTWQIAVITFDEQGTPQLDLSFGVRPAPAVLFGLALACRTQAAVIFQQALMASQMAAVQQQQQFDRILRPS